MMMPVEPSGTFWHVQTAQYRSPCRMPAPDSSSLAPQKQRLVATLGAQLRGGGGEQCMHACKGTCTRALHMYTSGHLQQDRHCEVIKDTQIHARGQ